MVEFSSRKKRVGLCYMQRWEYFDTGIKSVKNDIMSADLVSNQLSTLSQSLNLTIWNEFP
jgi:hypothetical protein